MNTLTREHRELLGLDGRGRPDLYLSAEEVLGAPHATAMRLAFETLGLAGVLCVEATPTIAFLIQDSDNRQQLDSVHHALWNQGLASLLLVIRPREVHAYSLVRKPVHKGWRSDGGEPDPRLVETLELTARGMEAFDLVTAVESGRFFTEHAKDFDRESRVDRVLLANLIETRERLVRQGVQGKGLSTEQARAQAQALLLQIMFIAYLEDRGLLGETILGQVVGGRASTLEALLENGDPGLVQETFAVLRKRFNGDLFLTPCAFDGPETAGDLQAEDLGHLAEFRRGLVELDTGQGRFWPYDFRYIPVDLISAVYDRFLGEDAEHQRASGAYYTPRALADLTVDQVWEFLEPTTRHGDDFRILDPACGSGIFLVRAFQRLAEDLRRENGRRHLPWDSLLALVSRIHGWDREPSAVRIAVFSLYIALLEEAGSVAVRERLEEGKLLPPLFGRTLRVGDFFCDESPDMRFHMIVGNPPWVSRRQEFTESARRWCNAHDCPFPEGQLAWGFVWKALTLLEPAGLVGFLLPAMGFFLNHKPASIEARRAWLTQVRVYRVINFSDLRFQLFEGAVRPTALAVFRGGDRRAVNYSFGYWCPKADKHLTRTGILTLPSEDRSQLHLATVLDEAATWKRRMWMRSPEAKLLQWLGAFPKLEMRLTSYRRARSVRKPWIIGQGLQPASSEEQKRDDFTPAECAFDPTLPHLESEAFRKWTLPDVPREPFRISPLRRCGFERGFHGPHVIIAQGTTGASSRLQAAYVEEDLTFRHSLQAICFPMSDAASMKLLTAVLNSGLAAWFFFHEAANLAAERAKVHEEELLRLPFEALEDLDKTSERWKAAQEIVRSVDRLLRDRSDAFFDALVAESEDRLDRLVYSYFGLSSEQIAVVEDGLQTIIPSVQPRRGAQPPLWRTSRETDWQLYFDTLSSALGGWFDGEEIVVGNIVGYNEDLVVLRLGFDPPSDGQAFAIRSDRGHLRNILTRLRAALPSEHSANLHLLPDLRVFLDDDLYLVKPRTIRWWLSSTALDDADAIAAHLFESGHGGHGSHDT